MYAIVFYITIYLRGRCNMYVYNIVLSDYISWIELFTGAPSTKTEFAGAPPANNNKFAGVVFKLLIFSHHLVVPPR